MAMGRREDQQKQEPLWIAHSELASAPRHPFYEKLSELLEAERFYSFVEGVSASSTRRSSGVLRCCPVFIFARC
jgi:hypothetical protein